MNRSTVRTVNVAPRLQMLGPANRHGASRSPVAVVPANQKLGLLGRWSVWALLVIGLLGSNRCYAADLSEGPGFDFSDNQNQPTLFGLTLGDNFLTASTGGPVIPGGGSTIGNDAEFVGVIVPAGLQLDAVVLTAFQHTTQNNRVFVGYEAGSTSLPHSILDYTNGVVPELPNSLFGSSDVGAAVFSQLGLGPFAFWIQETHPDAATYTMNFRVIPEPNVGVVVMAGCFVSAMARWRLGRRSRSSHTTG